MEPRKQAILAALRKFAEQRPGMDPRNYGSRRDYCNEAARVTDDLADVRTLLVAVGANDGITADMLLQEGSEAKRLSLLCIVTDESKGAHSYASGLGDFVTVGVNYTTGQYFPTEYRKAVCQLLSAVLWTWTREHAMPAHAGMRIDGTLMIPSTKGFISQTRWLRAHFKREFGRRIASRYFD